MPVTLADTFLPSLIKLGRGEQKSAAEFVAKFQENPANPGISLERIYQTKDKNVWSARVTHGLRAILYKDGEVWNVLFIGNHDDAYAWASRRSIERNQRTGSLQIVVAPEEVADVVAPIEEMEEKAGVFDSHEDDYLLSLGVPDNWLPTIRKVKTEEQLWQVVAELPEEVAERLLDLSCGKIVTPPTPVDLAKPAIEAEESQRRFYVIEDSDELLRMLAAPMSKWIGFLHPSQKRLATGNFNGPVKVTGSAGTGKTVVAMHRARYLARQGKNVLLTSFVGTLCENIRENLKYLCSSDELSRITVDTVHAQALQIVRGAGLKPTIADDQEISRLIQQFHWGGCPLDERSLQTEWTEVIQAQGIKNWDDYRDASRKGRGRGLGVKERKLVWQVFEQVFQRLNRNFMVDWSGLCQRARELVEEGKAKTKYDAVIIDEVQDLKPQEIRFLSSLAKDAKNGLMLVGDGGQRIYGGKITLKSLGVDVRGRSYILKINYRTTAQIRAFAEKLLSGERDDLDEGVEDRTDTKSLLRGPLPTLRGFRSQQEEIEYVGGLVARIIKEGVKPTDIAIFARTRDLLAPYEKYLKSKRIDVRHLKKESSGPQVAGINLGTMHRAKGLEFKVVFVVDASSNNVPLPFVVRQSQDPGDREDAFAREKHLLYVSVTRARDEVYVTWNGQPSPFLESAREVSEAVLAKR